MLAELNAEDRLRLMRFICSFAWADLEVQDEERGFVAKMAAKLGLSDEEIDQVREWLEVPPKAEDLDPSQIPREHRQLFIDAARAMVVADGRVDPEEAENLALFEMLVQD
ncbi:MAG: TerB family tellurite resistance protein [Deltaproteobacteria bacterium]|nr:TerB family tellurite resistance protein [Deltaproteobacteria bacterium]